MAKRIVAKIKLQIPAGQANPAPPVGPALGQRRIQLGEFGISEDAHGVIRRRVLETVLGHQQAHRVQMALRGAGDIRERRAIPLSGEGAVHIPSQLLLVAQVQKIGCLQGRQWRRRDDGRSLRLVLGPAGRPTGAGQDSYYGECGP